MATWREIAAAAPELAAAVRGRFEAFGVGLLATVRHDGSPRISGIEPLFHGDYVWMGMMEGSLKAMDLRRDPRFALHSTIPDKNVPDGDARIAGRAVEIDDDTTKTAISRAFAAESGSEPPGPYHLFRIDVGEVVFVRPEGNELVIRSWHAGTGERRVART
jgi:Pyridoxamine 5'-phosphate oxidase